jgi:hypothetical protein
MLKINFLPDHDDPKLIKIVEEYEKIWGRDGDKITVELEKITELEFKEKEINAIVFAGISHSNPLALNDSASHKYRKAVLVHE